MRNCRSQSVLIIQGQMKQYRVPFFEKLRVALSEDGVKLKVGYSDPPISGNGKRDNCNLSPDYGLKVKGYRGLGNRIIWQPLLREAASADLVVVEQANKYAMNYILLLGSALGVKELAFWGHAENKQEGQLGISEWYRRKMLNRTDWWFAYTAGTAEYLVREGVPREKITVVQNSIDTHELREQASAISPARILEERQRLGIGPEAPVGVFCGMLDRVKAVPFLIEAAKLVRKQIPTFHLIIAGGGPDAQFAERAASASGGWVHFIGPKFGVDKALTLRMSNVFLLPSGVGLAILDAFATGLPLLTTDIQNHGPEIEYLEEGVNGVKALHDTNAYANSVIQLLANTSHLRILGEGATRTVQRYSVEIMVQNFARGVFHCLNNRS
jgi:glycosyltransferase involved in cell wall biosynthesis